MGMVHFYVKRPQEIPNSIYTVRSISGNDLSCTFRIVQCILVDVPQDRSFLVEAIAATLLLNAQLQLTLPESSSREIGNERPSSSLPLSATLWRPGN
jgi:hypothetical protein